MFPIASRVSFALASIKPAGPRTCRWPSLVAVSGLIPLIGATLGAVICIAVALFATRLWPTTVLVLVFFVVYQQIENYLIAPRIMRGPVQLSAGAVLAA